MKTKINYLLIACIITMVCISNSFGQAGVRKSTTAARFEYGDKLSNPPGDGSLAESRVSGRALTAFSKSCPDAINAKWERVGNFYAVDFTKSEKKYKSLYNVKGNLIYSLFYGSENDLPRDIRKDVKREYIDYNITQAVNVNEDNRHVWLIKLDDENNLVTVAVEDGYIGELNRFTKSKD